MDKETIKKEVLSNSGLQTDIRITGNILGLFYILKEKGIIDESDIERIEEYTDNFKIEINESIVNEMYKRMEENKHE